MSDKLYHLLSNIIPPIEHLNLQREELKNNEIITLFQGIFKARRRELKSSLFNLKIDITKAQSYYFCWYQVNSPQ